MNPSMHTHITEHLLRIDGTFEYAFASPCWRRDGRTTNVHHRTEWNREGASNSKRGVSSFADRITKKALVVVVDCKYSDMAVIHIAKRAERRTKPSFAQECNAPLLLLRDFHGIGFRSHFTPFNQTLREKERRAAATASGHYVHYAPTGDGRHSSYLCQVVERRW